MTRPGPLVPGAGDVARLTFIGTATTLLQVGGLSILTDPNFLHRGDRAYVGLGISTRRRTEPARTIAQLPDLDFVVLSHHHGDHFDRIAARELDPNLEIVTEPHAAGVLRSQGFRRPLALTTWQSHTYRRSGTSVQVTAVPAKHAPRPLSYLLPPVMGSILDFARDGQRLLRVYITGDTLVHRGLGEIARRFPGIDLCVIHLGGTRIAGVLLTMDARQGVEALRITEPRLAVPVHFDDYGLFRSPLADFRRAAAGAGLATAIHYMDRGDTFQLPLKATA